MEIEITYNSRPECEFERQLKVERRASAAWETMATILLDLEREAVLLESAREGVRAG